VIVLKIGIIGTGTIGGMLTRAFAGLPDGQVTVFNRTPQKADAISREYKQVRVASSLPDLVGVSDLIFVCTKPADAPSVLGEIGPRLRRDQTLATTISQVSMQAWEREVAARIVKVIPSITQTVCSGVILVCYGSRFDNAAQEQFEALLGQIATPFVIDEHQLRLSSDLASCGPAFVAFILSQWSTAAARTGRLSQAECEYVLSKMLIGVANLLQNGYTLSEIVRRVSVPGGITQQGIDSFGDDLSTLFARLHQVTGASQTPSPALNPTHSGFQRHPGFGGV
jgi:competence protein ComER